MPNDKVEQTGLSLGQRLKLAGAAVVALLVLIVVLQNTESVQTDILFWSISMRPSLSRSTRSLMSSDVGRKPSSTKIASASSAICSPP